MLETLNDFVLRIMDVVLGWMLNLPTDVALIIVAVGTSAILTFVRPLVTNQDLLRRCKRDKKKQKQFIREAKRRRDKEAVKRHRAVIGTIGLKNMTAEGLPLLVSIVPIAMLAVWAFGRLAYLPPEPGEPVKVTAYTVASAIGKPVYMVPPEGVEVEDGLLKRVDVDPVKGPDGRVYGMATWTVKAEKSAKSYELAIRYAGDTWTKDFLVDGERYALPLELHETGSVHGIELGMRPYKPFGVIPGIQAIYFEPWLVGYLVICIPFVFVLRWLTGIH
jgi:hypothetical protein